MGDYSGRIAIDRPAAEVFAFVADIHHLPAFLPTVRSATPQGEGRILVEGAANGRHYRNDGWLRTDPRAMTMDWGSDGENDYRGHLHVIAGANGGGARVEIALHLTPRPSAARGLRARGGDADSAVQEGIDAALAAIKSLCEGTGITRRPTTAERRAAQAAAVAAADDAARRPRGSARPADDGRETTIEDSRPFGHTATMNPDL